MAAGKNKVHRKKRISKHVLGSQKRNEDDGSTTTGDDPSAPPSKDGAATTTTTAPKKKKRKPRTWDPAAGHAYLSAWKNRSSGEGVWKFNKNMQSNLIRHMYDCEKTPKGTFSLLIDYIMGSKGEAMRKRMEDDAMMKAMRYKDWEKSRVGEDGDDSKVDDDQVKEDAGSKGTDVGDEEPKSEETRWADLNAHGKRNEYKRARKVIDALKAPKET